MPHYCSSCESMQKQDCAPCYCGITGKIPTPDYTSSNVPSTPGQWILFTAGWGQKSLVPYLAFPDPVPVGEDDWDTLLQPHEGGILGYLLVFAGVCMVGDRVFSMVFSWSRAVVI